MKKLDLLKVGIGMLCTLTGVFASDASKWNSIQDLDSFVKYLINDKSSKMTDIADILDYLKKSDDKRYAAICGAVAGKPGWEKPYSNPSDKASFLPQAKASIINTKCNEYLKDKNLRPKITMLPPEKEKDLEPPVTLVAPSPKPLAPKPVAPRPVAPAPQMSLDDMMDAEISGSWESEESRSPSRAPSRSSSTDSSEESSSSSSGSGSYSSSSGPSRSSSAEPGYDPTLQTPDFLKMKKPGTMRSILLNSIKDHVDFYIVRFPKVYNHMKKRKDIIDNYLKEKDNPDFNQKNEALIKELKEISQNIQGRMDKLRTSYSDGDSWEQYDRSKEFGSLIDLAKQYASKRPEYLNIIDKQSKKEALTPEESNLLNNFRMLQNKISLKMDSLHRIYSNILDDFDDYYQEIFKKYNGK